MNIDRAVFAFAGIIVLLGVRPWLLVLALVAAASRLCRS